MSLIKYPRSTLFLDQFSSVLYIENDESSLQFLKKKRLFVVVNKFTNISYLFIYFT